jgi:hypothetical protein
VGIEVMMPHSTLRLMTSLLFLSLAAPAAAGTLGKLAADGGFVDARLGDPIESFAGLERIGVDADAGTETYLRHSDVFTVGGARVDSVTYSFYQGRLYFISIRMTGRENAQAVLNALKATFGDCIETGNRPNELIWTGGEVFVLYDLDAESGRGMAAMTSAPIHAQMRMDRSGAAPARYESSY